MKVIIGIDKIDYEKTGGAFIPGILISLAQKEKLPPVICGNTDEFSGAVRKAVGAFLENYSPEQRNRIAVECLNHYRDRVKDFLMGMARRNKIALDIDEISVGGKGEMIEVTASVSNIRYRKLVKRVLPKTPDFVVNSMKLVPQDKRDDLAISLLNKNEKKIAEMLTREAGKRGLYLTVESIRAEK